MIVFYGSPSSSQLQRICFIYNLENEQKKVLAFVLTLVGGSKMLKNLFQNTWKTFSNLQSNFYETRYTKETTSKAATTEFLTNIPNRKKYLMNNLTFSRRKYF